MRRSFQDDFDGEAREAGVDFDRHAPSVEMLERKARALAERATHLDIREDRIQEAEEQLRLELERVRRAKPHPEADGLSFGEVDDLLASQGARELFRRFSDDRGQRKPLQEVDADEQLRLLSQAIRGEIVRHFGLGEVDQNAADGGRELLRQWVRSKIGVIGSDLILSLVGIQKDSWSRYEVKAYGDSNPTMRDLQTLAREETVAMLRPQIRATLKEQEKEIVDLYRARFAEELRRQVGELAATNARAYAAKMISDVGERLAADALMSIFPFIGRIKALEQLGRDKQKLDEAP